MVVLFLETQKDLLTIDLRECLDPRDLNVRKKDEIGLYDCLVPNYLKYLCPWAYIIVSFFKARQT